ncbi:MAG: hypothetical protein R6U15_03715 [Candidatus Izemoplasmatales bacterium]
MKDIQKSVSKQKGNTGLTNSEWLDLWAKIVKVQKNRDVLKRIIKICDDEIEKNDKKESEEKDREYEKENNN